MFIIIIIFEKPEYNLVKERENNRTDQKATFCINGKDAADGEGVASKTFAQKQKTRRTI